MLILLTIMETKWIYFVINVKEKAFEFFYGAFTI